MEKLTIDLESRSRVNLPKAGLHRYAMDDSTDVMCFAYKWHGQPPRIWIPPTFEHLYDFSFEVATDDEFKFCIDAADVIDAHNASFELAMWAGVMVRKYGFPCLSVSKMRCSAALAAYYALPRSLDGACKALGVAEQKDDEGKKVMMRFCKPRKPTKKWPTGWYEDADDFTRLCAYCRQDVVAEESLSDALPPLPDDEQAVWLMDHTINNRGIGIDTTNVTRLKVMVEAEEKALLAEVSELTGGQVDSVRQIAKTLAWLKGQNVFMDSLAKNFVSEALRGEMLPQARRLLEIRQMLGKSSVSKLDKMLVLGGADSRVRGTMLYHGASTGRWCLTPEHEVLTPQGWTPLGDWVGDTPIMQWDTKDKSLSWCNAAKHTFNYRGELVSYDGRFASFRATPEHRLALVSSKGNRCVKQAAVVVNNTRADMSLSGVFYQKRSEALTRVLVMVQADGHYVTEKRNGRLLRFRFVKPRKIKRCKNLLSEYDLPFDTTRYDDATVICVRYRDIPKEIWDFRGKQFDILGVNVAAFIDELPHWDSYVEKSGTSFVYYTNSKHNADAAATSAHLVGKAASVSVRENRNPKWATSYRVTIRNADKTRLMASSFVSDKYSGLVMCPETKTGFFIARHRGKIFVTGNSGKGIQPQNYPRDSYGEGDINKLVELSADEIELFYDDIFRVASRSLRGMLTALGDSLLMAVDFSSIEARVLAWLCNEEKTLDAFRRGLDVYRATIADIDGVSYDDVTKAQRQIGKVAVLALGYQGWLGAFESMATTYGVEMPDEERVKEIILAWRKANPRVVAFWRGVELAAIRTIRTRKPHAYGRVKFGIRGKFLHCRLPSGRLLSYCSPAIVEGVTPYGEVKMSIRFMGVDSTTRKGTRQATYGGKLTENIVQAISRDLLVAAMLRTEAAGYKTVFHVHDEIVVEGKFSEGDLQKFINLMVVLPSWAKGCPIAADGWIGKRYRK